jgi:RNA polymerase sigma-32 factor
MEIENPVKKEEEHDPQIEASDPDPDESESFELIPFKDSAVPSVPDAYKSYVREISRIPVLSREEENRLSLLYREKGDKDAGYTLIISNLRLVVKIAMMFHKSWMKNISDLIQEGNIGLIEALKRYDPYKNVRFSSYSSYWIKAYIIKFIMDNYSLIRIGKTQAQRKLFFQLNKEKKKLEQSGYSVGPKLLAERLNVREKDIIEMESRLGSSILSLDEPVKGDAASKHIDFMATGEEPIDEALARDEMKDILREKLSEFKEGLNHKERYIFENRIFSESPKNLREIGAELNFSRERARQVEGSVLEKLKKFLKKNMPGVSTLE